MMYVLSSFLGGGQSPFGFSCQKPSELCSRIREGMDLNTALAERGWLSRASMLNMLERYSVPAGSSGTSRHPSPRLSRSSHPPTERSLQGWNRQQTPDDPSGQAVWPDYALPSVPHRNALTRANSYTSGRCSYRMNLLQVAED